MSTEQNKAVVRRFLAAEREIQYGSWYSKAACPAPSSHI